jgi:hypothetical protein
VAELEAELAVSKREHIKFTSARIVAELEKAHVWLNAELKAERQERERSTASAERNAAEAKLRAELTQLKTEERCYLRVWRCYMYLRVWR